MGQEQWAVITGASSGIGMEFARVFSQENYNVVLSARRQERLQSLADELKGKHKNRVIVVPGDLGSPGGAQSLYTQVKKEVSDVDVLVNNAGLGNLGPFVKQDLGQYKNMIQVNITSLTELTHYFLQDMVKRKSGNIINVASTAAFQPGPMMAVYYASKAYVLSFSEAINNELLGTGVHVTALCPGATKSEFFNEMDSPKLIQGKKLPSSMDVARYGYKAMRRGQTVAIHGITNSILAQSVRLLPRRAVTGIVRRLQDSGF